MQTIHAIQELEAVESAYKEHLEAVERFREAVCAAYEAGYSSGAIAEQTNLSRQRIWQITQGQ